MEETVERLGAKEFVSTVKKSGLDATLENDVTLFVVPDSAYTTFAEQMWENVSMPWLYKRNCCTTL